VVDGTPTTSHTPLSGQFSPVFAVVPTVAIVILQYGLADGGIVPMECSSIC
jgi:hypothetical protein